MGRLKERRLELGLTQAELAKKSGVSRNTIATLESGEQKNPLCETLIKLAKTLEIDVEELLGIEDF